MVVQGRVLLITLGCFASLVAEGRTWRNDVGVEMEGELFLLREKDAVLKLPDGRKALVPLKVLSGEDMTYVREWEQSGKNISEDEAGLNEQELRQGFGEKSSKAHLKSRWLDKVSIKDVFFFKTIQESPDFYVYESDHFHIESPRKLHDGEKKHLVSIFEGGVSVLSELPFDLPLARLQAGVMYTIQVFFDASEYEKAGGDKKSRVSMTPSRFLVLLKRNSQGKSRGLDGVKTIGILSKWVSQFSGDVYWLGEGFSKYMQLIPVKKHTYDFSDWSRIASSIPGPIRRQRLPLPILEKLMTKKGDVSLEKSERGRNGMSYGALLAFIYFARMEGEGNRENLRKYMNALQSGKDNPLEILLNQRSWKDVELEMILAWKKYGVSLRFEKEEKDK